MKPKLTKSDFKIWKQCPKSFWLERHRPAEFGPKPPSEFDRLLMQNGFAVEAEAVKLVANWKDSSRWSFQRVFAAQDGVYARADLVGENLDGSVDIIEIKSSSRLKGSDGSDHRVDASFQKIAAERSGTLVRSVAIMHVDGKYELDGEVEPAALLKIVDVTTDVDEMSSTVSEEIDAALAWLASEEIDEAHCDCRYVGSIDKRCSAFEQLNPDVPDPSVHLLPRISNKKLRQFDSEGRLGVAKVSLDEVSPLQQPVLKALQSGDAIIDKAKIAEFIETLNWPLWFYDYETYASAVPIAQGHRPHLQIPVQFSVHRLDEDGILDHGEFLAEAPGQEKALISSLRDQVGDVGSAVCWNMSTEKSCNDRLAALQPEYAEWLSRLNERTIDLMDVFKKDWVEPGFRGSTSIKKVLPVLAPELTYPENDVHDGTGAIIAWKELITTDDGDRRQNMRRQLLAYCKLDTLAMVRIFQRLLSAIQ